MLPEDSTHGWLDAFVPACSPRFDGPSEEELRALSLRAAAALSDAPVSLAVDRFDGLPDTEVAAALAAELAPRCTVHELKRLAEGVLALRGPPSAKYGALWVIARTLEQHGQPSGELLYRCALTAGRSESFGAYRWVCEAGWTRFTAHQRNVLAVDAAARALIFRLPELLDDQLLLMSLSIKQVRLDGLEDPSEGIARGIRWVQRRWLDPMVNARIEFDQRVHRAAANVGLPLDELLAPPPTLLPMPDGTSMTLPGADVIALSLVRDLGDARALPASLRATLYRRDPLVAYQEHRDRIVRRLQEWVERLESAEPEEPKPIALEPAEPADWRPLPIEAIRLREECSASNLEALVRATSAAACHQVLAGLSDSELNACVARLQADEHLAAEVFRKWACVHEIRFTHPDGGAHASLADVAIQLARCGESPPVEPRTPIRVSPPPATELLTLLSSPLWALRGRTAIYQTPNGYVACKIQREDEDTELLHREAHWMDSLAHEAESDVPRPGGVGPVDVPASLAERIARAGVMIDAAPSALFYSSAGGEYWNYVNELPGDARRIGMRRATSDLFRWLRRGIVYTALTTKNHSATRSATRRYEWMVDVMMPPQMRAGMGRLDRVKALGEYPNVRATGLADFAELAYMDELELWTDERADSGILIDPVANLHNFPVASRRRLKQLRFVGDYLFDLTLLVVDSYCRHGAIDREAELAAELAEVWSTAFSALQPCDVVIARRWLSTVVSFERMARQLAYFHTPSRYAPELDAAVGSTDPESRRAVEERLRVNIYDRQVARVRVDLAPERWLRPGSAPALMGFSSDGKHLDIGAFNGPLGLPELEYALYVAGSMMCIPVP